MAKSSPDAIILDGDGNYESFISTVALNPGHFVTLDSAGKIGKTGSISTVQEKWIVNISATKAKGDTYASGDSVPIVKLKPAMICQARVRATAPAIVIGDELQFHTDGTVAKRTSGEVIGIARLAITNNTTSEAFITLEIV